MQTTTLQLDAISQELWDAVVVGAGPAGSLCARLLASAGARVLLVDRCAFPRTKVCGCCLSGAAVRQLSRLGLADVLDDAVPLDRFVLGIAGRTADVAMTGGRALSRDRFDSRLAEHAVAAGAEFLPETTAQLGPVHPTHRLVHVQRNGERVDLSARLVLVCSGLGQGQLKPTSETEEQVDPHSLIGLTATTPPVAGYPPGTIWMAVHSSGYVGLVVLEDGRLNVSAAVNKTMLRKTAGPSQLTTEIIAAAGLPIPPGLSDSAWLGTRELTRRVLRPAAERTFILGDAAGYVEPFTGQGMTWALAAAELVQPLARDAIARWDQAHITAWTKQYRRAMRTHQRTCKWVGFFTRRPQLLRRALPAIRAWPQLTHPIVRSIHGAHPQQFGSTP